MNANELVNVGESALVFYTKSAPDLDAEEGVSPALTVNIHVSVDKVIIYAQGEPDTEEGTIYVADFVRFEEADGEDGFYARFAKPEKVGPAEASWFSFSGRSDTAALHIQPTP
jgi:hypothetical protein